jgi:hypothetical protein
MLAITPSRPSLAMYGKLGEQTGVKDWAMRRLDKGSIPASSLRGLAEQTGVKDWAMRRLDKGSIPASSLRGMGENVGVKNWAMRRLDKGSIPQSSLNGSWPVNPLAGTGNPLAEAWPVNPLAGAAEVMAVVSTAGREFRQHHDAFEILSSPAAVMATLREMARSGVADPRHHWEVGAYIVAVGNEGAQRYPSDRTIRSARNLAWNALLSDNNTTMDRALRSISIMGVPTSKNVIRNSPMLRGIGEQTGVKDWAMRRLDKGSIPQSSLSGQWPVNPLADGNELAGQWPVNPLAGPWPVNPLAETTFVGDQERRRHGKRAIPASSLAELMGFGALDGQISVRTAQETMRKLGICIVNGRPLAVDGTYGPQTDEALLNLASQPGTYRVMTRDLPNVYMATDGANTIRVDTAWWQRVETAAAGLVDSCPSSSSSRTDTTTGGRSGTSPSPDGGGYMPPEGSMMDTLSSPWVLLGIAAALGAGYWWYTSESDEFAY